METHFEYIRRDLDDIKKSVAGISGLASKRDLVAWAGIYLAIAAMIVGGIVGGLTWFKPDSVVIERPAEVAGDKEAASPSRPE